MNPIFFTSDAHLGAAVHKDSRSVELRLVRWMESIADTAGAIYFLGDMFDYWHEWRYTIPKGYTRFLGTVARLVDRGVEVHIFTGNHDVWMKGYFEEELGTQVHHHAIQVNLGGKTFRLAHGDEECKERSFRESLLYNTFRSPTLQALYASIHPRWSTPIAQFSSNTSRQHHGDGDVPEVMPPVEEEWLIQWAARDAVKHPEVDYWLFGHRHRLADYSLGNGRRVLLLGDWIRYNSYAEWDGEELSLNTFSD